MSPGREKYVPPGWSKRIYIRLARQDAALFKFLLESHDNLAYMSMVDRYSCVVQLVFSPDQERELRLRLDEISQSVDFVIPRLSTA